VKEIDETIKGLPIVQKVDKRGYEIYYHFHEQRPTIYFRVVFQALTAALATVRFDRRRGTLFTQTIIVFESHRRRGIANALMICAIALTGCKPIPTASLSKDARSWWEQVDRPW
jgi:hypothetical protein